VLGGWLWDLRLSRVGQQSQGCAANCLRVLDDEANLVETVDRRPLQPAMVWTSRINKKKTPKANPIDFDSIDGSSKPESEPGIDARVSSFFRGLLTINACTDFNFKKEFGAIIIVASVVLCVHASVQSKLYPHPLGG